MSFCPCSLFIGFTGIEMSVVQVRMGLAKGKQVFAEPEDALMPPGSLPVKTAADLVILDGRCCCLAGSA